MLTKYVPCNNAIRIVDLALEVVGGAGFFRRSPLERMYRDVRAGVIMPYNNPEARSSSAATRSGSRSPPRCPRRSPGIASRRAWAAQLEGTSASTRAGEPVPPTSFSGATRSPRPPAAARRGSPAA